MTPAMSRGIRRRQQKDFEARLIDAGCDPIAIMIAFMSGKVPCTCENDPGCKYCEGKGYERVDMEIRAKAVMKAVDKLAPDLRSVEARVTHEHSQTAVSLSRLAPEELDQMERLMRKAALPAGEVVDVDVVN